MQCFSLVMEGKGTILIASLLLMKQQWGEERVKNERRKCEIQVYYTDSPMDSISLNTVFFLVNVYIKILYCILEYFLWFPPAPNCLFCICLN